MAAAAGRSAGSAGAESAPATTLTVVKDANPSDPQDFSFSGTGTGISGFTLDDDGDQTNDNSRTFSLDAQLGPKTVTESAQAGWTLTGLGCTGDSEAQTSTANRTVNLDVDSGETIVCTFTNTKDATVRYTKVTDPASDPQDFGFTVGGAGLVGDTLDTDPGSVVPSTHVDTLDALEQPGTKTITESVPAGWELTGRGCTDTAETPTANGVSFSVAPGADIVCTFTNTKLGPEVDVEKTGPALAHLGDVLPFTFEVTNPNPFALHDVSVTDDRCSPVVEPPVMRSNDDGDDLLENPGVNGTSSERWTYMCSYTLAGEADPVPNVALVTAVHGAGEAAKPGTDVHTTDVLHPAIEVDETLRRGDLGSFVEGPIGVELGDSVEYRLSVTNPGDAPLTVGLDDPTCDPGTLTGQAGDSDGDVRLDPPETWVFLCSHRVTAGDGALLRNAVTVTGTDALGGPKGQVTAGDAEDVTVSAPDDDPPTAALSGRRIQKLGRAVRVTVSCPVEACAATGRGTVAGAGKRRRLRRAAGQIARGEKKTLALRVPRKARAAILRALRAGKRVRATVTVTATDAAGNATVAARRIRLRR